MNKKAISVKKNKNRITDKIRSKQHSWKKESKHENHITEGKNDVKQKRKQ